MRREGANITDDWGRILMLRGVNLGGSSKIPATIHGGNPGENPRENPGENPGESHGDFPKTNYSGDSPESAKPVSFVGRPFPLEDAEGHFERLKNWGFTFIRLVITWEALEHEGPGIYDEAYLAYLRKLLLIAEKKGISVYMDPHQDVWSRWTGGDGAPAWTLEKLGMDLTKLEAVGAAIDPCLMANEKMPATHTPRQKAMIWPVNYSLYAAATMFTVFFAGNAFAPELSIDGESAQDFLQSRYIAALRHCYRRLKNCAAISGWGTMNEPHPGYIGYEDLSRLENATLALGTVPSPFQAMIASSGRPVEIPVYTPWLKGSKKIGKKTINPQGYSLFIEGFSCPWREAGIWADENGDPKLLKPGYFSAYRGRPVRFTDDFLKPFMLRFMEKMEEADRPALFFIEGIPHGETPSWSKDEPFNAVNAFHHYDGFTLFTRSYRPWLNLDPKTGKIILGKKKVASHFSAKLAEAKAWARNHMGGMPCLLGEFGLPFNLNKGKAYKTGDYRLHEHALSVYYDAIDENLLHSTIWNYSADNTHEEGDKWNGEDLSIFSGGEGRAMGGWLRPYPMATAGIPLKFTWDRKKAAFYFRFRSDPALGAAADTPTEIFLPSEYFGKEPEITLKTNGKDGGSRPELLRAEYRWEEQRLFIYNDGCSGEVEAWVYGLL